MAKGRTFRIERVSFPLARPFRISRGVKDAANLVRVMIGDGHKTGAGECCPYPRYGENIESVVKTLENIRAEVESGLDRETLQLHLPPGAARNALDCALWDLEAKKTGKPVSEKIDLLIPARFPTMRTVVIDAPEKMAREAAGYPKGTTLKVKLDMEDVMGRLQAIRRGAPLSPIAIDANEGWSAEFLGRTLPDLKRLGVILIEQPLPVGEDEALKDLQRAIPICADESCHTRGDLEGLTGLYDAINIKLDKTGGLTEALGLLHAARRKGFKIMVGCMVSSSLSIAPIAHLCSHADYIDLDGPLLLRPGQDGAMLELPEEALVKLETRWGRP